MIEFSEKDASNSFHAFHCNFSGFIHDLEGSWSKSLKKIGEKIPVIKA